MSCRSTAAGRRAVADGQRPSVHAMGENGLRVERVDQIDALVIGFARQIDRELVGAVKHDEARVGLSRTVSSTCARRPGPLADRAPAFDAIVACDLAAGRYRLQLRKRERRRGFDQSAHFELPVGETLIKVARVDLERGMVLPLVRNRVTSRTDRIRAPLRMRRSVDGHGRRAGFRCRARDRGRSGCPRGDRTAQRQSRAADPSGEQPATGQCGSSPFFPGL